MKWIMLVLILGCLSGAAYAHKGEFHEEDYAQSFETVLPWTYFLAGQWFAGLIMVLFWIGIIHGVYTLTLFVLARLLATPARGRR